MKTAEQLVVERHTASLHRGFHVWPELKHGKPPALGDYRWTADLILSTWLQAETGMLPNNGLEHRVAIPAAASMCWISDSCLRIGGFRTTCRLIFLFP